MFFWNKNLAIIFEFKYLQRDYENGQKSDFNNYKSLFSCQ